MLATYEKTIYKNDKNGFCIFGMVSEDDGIPDDARNKYYKDDKIHFSVVGYGLPAAQNMTYELSGRWEESRYGLQFHVETYTEVLPKTKEGIAAYLSSGLIKGIGEATAKQIVSQFGTETFSVIENNPQKLLEIRGITENKLKNILSSYHSSKGIQEILTFLSPYGVTVNKAQKIQQHFGSRAIQVIQHSPFLLCDISGFGFKTVDEIARKVNFQPADPLRIEGGINCVLEEAKNQGHLFLLHDEILKKADELLSECVPEGSITYRDIKTSFYNMCGNNKVILEDGRAYLPKLYQYETQTARRLSRILIRKADMYHDLERHIREAQQKCGIRLSEKQYEAVKMCIENNCSIITGGPGTGKTTVLKVILNVYAELNSGKEILLTAPTGRAARKMAESTGYFFASTLHSALGMNSDDMRYDDDMVLSADFIIIDETSMLDMQMAYYLFESLGSRAKLLFVGDVDQLPSVGAGNVLKEMIDSRLVPVTVLDMVFRQKDTSRIALNAQSIKKGETKLLYGDDFQFIPAENAEEAASIICEEHQKYLDMYDLENIQVLTPFRAKSSAGAVNLNRTLQEIINPCTDKKQEISYGASSFRYHDKVMQMKNMDEVSNGDIGFVSMVRKDSDKPITVSFSESRFREYGKDELNSIDLAYATTIHKSQGSEYECVIIPILSSFYIMLQRALIYTGITRAKKKVILVGQKKAIFAAIHNNSNIKRNTALAERIQREYNCLKQKKEKADTRKKLDVEQLTL